MTCIVAITKKDIVYFGGDTQRSQGSDIAPNRRSKIWKTKLGGVSCVIGTSGDSRMNQLLQYEYEWPEIERFNCADEVHLYLAKFVASSFVKKCDEIGILENKLGVKDTRGTVIIGIVGNIFLIDGGGAVSRITQKYAAIGSGRNPAMASLYTSKMARVVDPHLRLQYALTSASRVTNSCSAPFTFLSA